MALILMGDTETQGQAVALEDTGHPQGHLAAGHLPSPQYLLLFPQTIQ